MQNDHRRELWERRTEWPLTIGAAVFLVAYAWPILQPSLSQQTVFALEMASLVAWAVFIVDYGVRLALAEQRLTFVRGNLLDLAVVLLPLLRPLQLLRLVTLLGVLNRKAGGSLRGRVAVYVVGGTLTVIVVAALAMLDAERGAPDATIANVGDALWWATVTVTTVGYGDTYPVTVEGRVVAVGLMLAGIALLGVVTATFASWLIERVQDIEEESEAATRRDVHELSDQIAELRALVERLGGEPDPDA
ncbi:potassium channel family protein [Phycicoccus sp. CSK15P-2]|uniref:potassium channel family protein n=1 Tax=Phycicoccus sp. CSK15P-2 TaxID=2807627 RepID=UPI001EF2B357|nr:potassium channel family protein [Phycicoccus sp. CSK15P-2]